MNKITHKEGRIMFCIMFFLPKKIQKEKETKILKFRIDHAEEFKKEPFEFLCE